MSRAPGKGGSKDLTAEDRRIWARVSGTVTPPKSRKAARVTPGAAPLAVEETEPLVAATRAAKTSPKAAPRIRAAAPNPPPASTRPTPAPGARPAPSELEPRRQRRLSRERDPIEATLDLHGFGRFEAEDQLRAFLGGCQARGMRAVLVITGQGRRGGGVIRSSVHEWLHAPALRGVVSGFASAHRRHGGDGAIYVTLKRR